MTPPFSLQYGRVGRMDDTSDPFIERHLGKSWDQSVYNVTQAVLR